MSIINLQLRFLYTKIITDLFINLIFISKTTLFFKANNSLLIRLEL